MSLSLETMLQLCIILPLLATILIALTGHKPNLREAVSIGMGLVVLYCVIKLYHGMTQGEQINVSWWELMPGLTLSFSIEPLGILFALLTSFLWIITTIYSIGYMRSHHEKNQTRFYGYFSVAIGTVMGVAFAANLFTLFIFYELLTLSTYPLVSHSGTENAKKAGRIYLGLLLSTSIVFFLLAIVCTWLVAGTLDFTHGGVFDPSVNKVLAGGVLVLFLFGIGKAAIMPFHLWLPAAMVAPTPVSALLHAVAVVKAGVFAVLKVCVLIFGLDLLAILPTTQFLLYIVGVTVFIASIIAMRQDNLKARLAYSTISQLGYVTIGALIATSSGVIGSAMHIVMHAFGKITLFFCAGAILVTTQKSNVSEMHGLGKQMPLTMAAFFIASLSIIGVPPTGGSWSKWYLLLGTVESEQFILMLVLLLSSLMNIAYLLPIPFNAFFSHSLSHQQLDSRNTLSTFQLKEAPPAALIAIGITTVGCLLLFIYPQPIFDLARSILEP
ncbi:monovalent cation/H+ antiporter subunit D family protein [Shewanella eurypsychrophilus]|uniref:Monovalent cation/H+ antiporter subunit D family protein n=1 Tax=Shewanella eurypsychrophilus TaxID=2593656 RepID=A0ABX6V780_9GAMM|nr:MULTISPECIES: proton-conducting transporter membrane subunit [Shewanella]QFU23189.1 monovalent cation/H+ antiporter subunit D family protein [Shewanella sp. YLB-09]QPG58472.1 monovalent cation/H+ antiporter subunit D family protein [Shewanella eurypsychrophilus]